MFLTITIDTAAKKKKSPVRFHIKKRIADWRKPLNVRKRSLQQKVRSWMKGMRGGHHYYRPAAF